MVNKKLFLIPVLFFLLVSFVSAVGVAPDSADTLAYWKLENLTDSTGNSNTLTNYNATSGATGIIDNAYSFDGSNDYMTSPADTNFGTGSFSLCAWTKLAVSLDDTAQVYSSGVGATGNAWFSIGFLDDGEVIINYDDGSDNLMVRSGATKYNDNTFHFVCMVVDRTAEELRLHIDNSLINTTDITGQGSINNAETDAIGRRGTTNNDFFEGIIDELSIFDTALTANNIEYLYGSGSPSSDQQWDFSSTSTYFDITNVNSINNITAYFNGTSYSTTNGTINTGIDDDSLFTIIVESNEGYYFNNTYTNYNISSDLEVNFTEYPYIYVIDSWNNSNLTNLNIEFNSINYTSNDTKKYLALNSSGTTKIYKTGYTTLSTTHDFTNSQDYNATLSKTNINVTLNNLSYVLLRTGRNITANWTLSSNLASYNPDQVLFIKNVNDSITYNTTNNYYILKDSDYQDKLEFWVMVNTSYNSINSSSLNISSGLIDGIIQINIRNIYGENLSNVNTVLNASETAYSNPAIFTLSNYFSGSDVNLSLNITDNELETYSETTWIVVNETTYEFNITMQPNKFTLKFYQDGSPVNISGRVTTEALVNSTQAFDSVNVTFYQSNLAEGYVKAHFGENLSTGNWTQFFEYINDGTTNILKDIEILNDPIIRNFFKVTDPSGSDLKDVTIRAYSADLGELNVWENYSLIGRRLTDNDGRTFFWFDNSDTVLLEFSKSGYTTKTITHQPSELTSLVYGTYSTPYIITLEPSVSTYNIGAGAYIPKEYTNETTSLELIIVARDYSRIKIDTSYLDATGGQEIELTSTCDSLNYCTYTLRNGYEFDNTASSFTIRINLDGSDWRTYAVNKKERTKLYTDEFDSLTTSQVNVMLLFGIIIITIIFGLIFRTTTAGIMGFILGVTISAFISSSYIVVLIILLVALALKISLGVIK